MGFIFGFWAVIWTKWFTCARIREIGIVMWKKKSSIRISGASGSLSIAVNKRSDLRQISLIPHMHKQCQLDVYNVLYYTIFSVLVNLVSSYLRNLAPTHWEAVKRILKYLNNKIHHKIVYHADTLEVFGYSYVNFGVDKEIRKSTSGHMFIFDGVIVLLG